MYISHNCKYYFNQSKDRTYQIMKILKIFIYNLFCFSQTSLFLAQYWVRFGFIVVNKTGLFLSFAKKRNRQKFMNFATVAEDKIVCRQFIKFAMEVILENQRSQDQNLHKRTLLYLHLVWKVFLQQIKYQIMGNIREKPDKTKDTEVCRHKKLTYVRSSMCGWRSFMEDSILSVYPYCQNQQLGLFGVFDGHGGPECAEYAVKYFPNILQNNENFKQKKYQDALTETFIKLDEMMKSKAGMKQLASIRSKHVEKRNAENYNGDTISGTTANVCLLTKDYIYVANAGDTRCIGITRGNNVNSRFKALSKDHKPQLDCEKQRIIKAGGVISQDGRINKNLNLSRALGDFSYKNNPNLTYSQQIISPVPDITKTSRIQLSHIILGCDGIWQTKSNEQMAKWFLKSMQGKNSTLRSIIESLFNEQIAVDPQKQQGLDNMSAIILQI